MYMCMDIDFNYNLDSSSEPAQAYSGSLPRLMTPNIVLCRLSLLRRQHQVVSLSGNFGGYAEGWLIGST